MGGGLLIWERGPLEEIRRPEGRKGVWVCYLHLSQHVEGCVVGNSRGARRCRENWTRTFFSGHERLSRLGHAPKISISISAVPLPDLGQAGPAGRERFGTPGARLPTFRFLTLSPCRPVTLSPCHLVNFAQSCHFQPIQPIHGQYCANARYLPSTDAIPKVLPLSPLRPPLSLTHSRYSPRTLPFARAMI